MSEKRQQRWFIVLYLMIVGTLLVMSKSIWTPMSKHGKKLIFLPNPMNKLPVSEVLTAIEQMLQDRTTP